MPKTFKLKIRPAIAGDVDLLGRLGTLLMAMHHEFDSRRFIPTSDRTPELYAGYLHKQLGGNDVMVLVAEADQDIAGYLYAAAEGPDYMALRGPAGVIHDLIVVPRYRRQGAGRLLLRAAVDTFKDLGLERIVLSTAYQNEHAHALFASEGFRPAMIEMTRDLNT